MMRLVIAIALLAIFGTGCSEEEGAGSAYDEQELISMRMEKDEDFRSGEGSPLPNEKRASFSGLRYFDPNPDYLVMATFEPTASRDTISLQTSSNEVRKALRAGVLSFTLLGKNLKLNAYTFLDVQGSESLFVPFTDATTGMDTYHAGRYLDIPVVDADEYVLDFNLAYNPYCAYNEQYSCPLVPKENDLRVAIRAGEKK